MKATKLITHGNYWTTFSSKEITQPKNNFSHIHDFALPAEEDNLVYEIANSELSLKNIVLSPKQKDIIKLILQERKDLKKIKKFNLPVTNKFLLYGPPGTGKTLSAYCIAGELGKKIYVVNLANLISSRLGETAKNLDKIFAKARNEGAILFIDEFDAISRSRDSVQEHGEIKRTVNVLLQILDLISEETLVIGATNRITDMDDAILRRFNYRIEYAFPSIEQLKTYIHFLKFSHNFHFTSDKAEKNLVEHVLGKSYADIQQLIINLLKRKIFNTSRTVNKISLTLADVENIKDESIS